MVCVRTRRNVDSGCRARNKDDLDRADAHNLFTVFSHFFQDSEQQVLLYVKVDAPSIFGHRDEFGSFCPLSLLNAFFRFLGWITEKLKDQPVCM
jgi:hypothetical protein